MSLALATSIDITESGVVENYLGDEQIRKVPLQQYADGATINLAVVTEISVFLKGQSSSAIAYHPAGKLVYASSSCPPLQGRSQFRMKASAIASVYAAVKCLYGANTSVDLASCTGRLFIQRWCKVWWQRGSKIQ